MLFYYLKTTEQKFCIAGIFMGQLICYYTVNREGNGGEKYPGKALIYKHYSKFYRKQKQEVSRKINKSMDRKDEVEIMEDAKVTETVTEQVKVGVDKDYGWLELDPFDDDN